MATSLPTKHALHQIGIITSVLVVLSTGLNADQHSIRDKAGDVGCVVIPPSTRSAVPDNDRVSIDVRVPITPGATLLGRLPPAKRDFSTLPIHVFLIQAPAKGAAASGRLAQTLPVGVDFGIKRLGVNPTPEGDLFVRVEYPRGALRGGVDLVAERTAQANDGERITSQTRCRITAADAASWR